MAATSLTSARHEAPTTTMTTPTTATAPSRTARRRSYRFQPWNVGRWLIWGDSRCCWCWRRCCGAAASR